MMTESTTTALDSVVQVQVESLDDTDCYASVWNDLLLKHQQEATTVSWGGRGKGGRGLARRTWQPKDVIVDHVLLNYVGSPNPLLNDASLRLFHGHVYAVLGRNGCGKSTLLRRMHAGTIPGFPPHISTWYIPQELIHSFNNDNDNDNDNDRDYNVNEMTPIEFLMQQYALFSKKSNQASHARIEELELLLDNLQLGDNDTKNDNNTNNQEDVAAKMEAICEEISNLEDEIQNGNDNLQTRIQHALKAFGIDNDLSTVPMSTLSGGQQKKVALATSLLCRADLLLLDEPTNHLDVQGLIQLRQLLFDDQDEESHFRKSIIVMVSHDIDLINDVATDMLSFSQDLKLYSFPGNYNEFVLYKHQQGIHELRQHVALEKKREQMLVTLGNLKKQPIPKRGGAKRKAKTISSFKKKIERQGIEKNEQGHKWKQQKAGTGIKKGSINGLLDATTKRGLSMAQMIEQVKLAPPHKSIQFVFRDPTSMWGEPLIQAIDVGHGYNIPKKTTVTKQEPTSDNNENDNSTDTTSSLPPIVVVKKEGYLFDGVDFCLQEGSKVCILGDNASGKSTLLRLLAKQQQNIEGTIHHATGVTVGYFSQSLVDELLLLSSSSSLTKKTQQKETALSYLSRLYPTKSEQDIRGELTSFGLGPTQATKTTIPFLSGGERNRLCLAKLMLQDPQVLIMDNPTCNLDVESVQALIYGLSKWKGSLIIVSHDANFIRSLDLRCYVLIPKEGKLRMIHGGMDAYLQTFSKSK